MRWQPGHESPDVVDRRGERGPVANAGIIWLVISLLRSRFGWVGVIIGLGVFAVLGGLRFLGGGGQSLGAQGGRPARADAERVQFVSFVLDDAQATWREKLDGSSKGYRNAKLVLFTDQTSSSCGLGRAEAGPFYCPSDERVYLDLAFFAELERRFGAPGDFAQAYVIAHEIGHHVQKVLGIEARAATGARRGEDSASVRLELQADCFAGVWANSTKRRDLLEAGDVDEGLRAAAAVGDDRLQREATGATHPETWTHGSSEQRTRWFRRGFEQGAVKACDTFAASAL
jgi:predicted metalloprotease